MRAGPNAIRHLETPIVLEAFDLGRKQFAPVRLRYKNFSKKSPMSNPPENPPREDSAPWQPLARNERRVVGVLAEKAKTTPENYPLSLNTLMNGCNQKSNRFPQMDLGEGQVEEALASLRAKGATAQVEGSGRVDKHRHLLYEWLGVDKVELAVMTELLLRGAQTLGELRGRAARMEKIAGISELRPIVESLQQKGLLLYLTPPGRGAVVTHALYQPQELEKLRAEHGNATANEFAPHSKSSAAAVPSSVSPTSSGNDPKRLPDENELKQLRNEVAMLRQDMKEMLSRMRTDLDEVRSELGMIKD